MSDNLNEFSRNVADFVLSRHPEWEENARAKSGFGESGYLEIELPSPAGSDLGAPARYSSLGGEVTVSLDAWHGHFSPAYGESWLEASLKTLDDLLTERLCVVSFWSGRACRGAELAEPSAPVTKRWYHLGVDRLKTRSWNGTYDQDRE